MEWQPIATCPCDDTRVLLWIDDRYKGPAFGRPWRYESGKLGGGAEGFNGKWNITHWMPLPDPPA